MTYRKDQKYNSGFLDRIVDKYIVSKSKGSGLIRTGAYLALTGLGFMFGAEYAHAREPRKPVARKKIKSRTPAKKSSVPKENKLSLEKKAIELLNNVNKQKTPFEGIKLKEQVLSLYNKAENIDKKTQEYTAIIKSLKQEISVDYSAWLMYETNPGLFHDGLITAKRTLGVHKARELEKQLRFSEMRKKRGIDKIKNQVTAEATVGRNNDSTAVHERLRISSEINNKKLGDLATEIIQQHREQRMITANNEEEVAQEHIGHIDLGANTWKLRLNLTSSGGREITTTKSKGFGYPISSTHRADSEIEYKTRILREFGGILAEIDLKELLPVTVIAGADYTQTETYNQTVTLTDIINIDDPNGSYPQETTAKHKTHVKEHMAYGGAQKNFSGGHVRLLAGHNKISERHGTGENRTVRHNNESWLALQTQVMFNNFLGVAGMITNGVMKDELLQPGETERSRENDILTKPRGGFAVVGTIPGTDITGFIRCGHTEGIDSGGIGIIATTGKNQNRAPKLLEMLTQETARDMGLLPGQTGKVKDLLDDVNRSLLKSMLETGNKYGLGIGLTFDIQTIPGNIPAWKGMGSLSIETLKGTISLEYTVFHGPWGGSMDFRLGYGTPDQRINLKLIFKQSTDKRNKDLQNEMGGGISWSF